MRKVLGLAFLALVSCSSTTTPAPVHATAAEAKSAAPTAIVKAIGEGKSAAFPVDAHAYDSVEWASLPIGVFDSGVGGLTVLDAILKLDEFDNKTHQPGGDGVPDFADERFVYFGDQANMPYGRYAADGKEDFLRELIVEDAAFLLGNRYWPTAQAPKPMTDKPLVKAVVVACNTATAYGIEDLRAAFAQWHIPMILVGVVEAGAEGAVATMKERNDQNAVAVMATVGTCKSQAYPKTIANYASAAGVKAPVTVVQQGSVGLAGAIEGDPAFVRASSGYQGPSTTNGSAKIDPKLAAQYDFDPAGLAGDAKSPDTWKLTSTENYVHYDVASLVEQYKKDGGSAPIGTVVLGCTHFPFQRERIAASFERLRTFQDASGAHPYEKLVSSHVELVDPAKLTAKQLYTSLVAKKRFRDSTKPPVLDANAFFISKPNVTMPDVKLSPEGSLETSYKYGRAAGNFDHETVKRVPLRNSDLTPELRGLLEKAMPGVWSSLQAFQSSRWVRN